MVEGVVVATLSRVTARGGMIMSSTLAKGQSDPRVGDSRHVRHGANSWRVTQRSSSRLSGASASGLLEAPVRERGGSRRIAASRRRRGSARAHAIAGPPARARTASPRERTIRSCRRSRGPWLPRSGRGQHDNAWFLDGGAGQKSPHNECAGRKGAGTEPVANLGAVVRQPRVGSGKRRS